MVIKPDNIGDVVLSSLLMPAIAERFKGVSIVYVVRKGLKDLLFHLHCISDVVEIPYDMGHGGGLLNSEAKERKTTMAVIKKYLKDYRPQLIIDLRTSPIGSFLAVSSWLSGTRYRVTLDIYRIKELFGNKMEREAKWSRHEVETFFIAMQRAGIFPPTFSYKSALRFWRLSDKHLEGFTLISKPFILVQPAAAWDGKRWPEKYFIELINSISKEYKQFSFILVGSKAEEDVCHKVFQGLDSDTKNKVINMAGKTSLKELIILINQAGLIVANDSGVAHIAGAFGRHTVVFFGPSTPERFSPLSLHQERIKVFHHRMECCPCNQVDCKYEHNENCLSHILPITVDDYIKNLLQDKNMMKAYGQG